MSATASQPITIYPVTTVDDAGVTSTSDTVLYPLANDTGSAAAGTIIAVSDPAITIGADGRSLIVPAGYVGIFNYTVNGGATANMTITASPRATATEIWSGLLTDADGAVVGSMIAARSTAGLYTTTIRYGAVSGRGLFVIPPGGTTVVPTAAGMLTAAVGADNLLVVTGGGYMRAGVSATSRTFISCKLPDGRAITASTFVADNYTFSFYAGLSRGITRGVLSGEFTLANLPSTDVTGEITYFLPPQITGLHRAGFDTVLVANGSIFNALTAVLPTGPGARAKFAGGIYIPKSQSAGGYFPGTTVGGDILLTQP